MKSVKLVRSIARRKPHLIQVWNESLMIGEYDTRTIGGRRMMDRDLALVKKVLGYEGFKVSMRREVVVRQ